jgi:hypothetical protein
MHMGTSSGVATSRIAGVARLVARVAALALAASLADAEGVLDEAGIGWSTSALTEYPHLKYAGYYWVDSAEYGRHMDAAYPYTNVAAIDGGDVGALDTSTSPPSWKAGSMAAAWRAKGNKVILNVGGFFFQPDAGACWVPRTPPDADWLSIVSDVVNRGDVYAFYVFDEPYTHCITKAQLESVITTLKTSFPTVPAMITEVNTSTAPPSNVDIMSLTCYQCTRLEAGCSWMQVTDGPTQCLPRYDSYRSRFSWGNGSRRMLLTVESFDGWSWGVMNRTHQERWYTAAGTRTYFEGMYWFMYGNVPGGLNGTAAYPEVQAAQTDIGRTILCNNGSTSTEYRPTLGANGEWYYNADQAKCWTGGVIDTWNNYDDVSTLQYYPLATPCRALDTRTQAGGLLRRNQDLNIPLRGLCGIPTLAKAVAAQMTVVGPTAAGHLRMRSASARPGTTVLNFAAMTGARASNGIVSLSDRGHAVATAYLQSSTATAHLVFDVTGYFADHGADGQELVVLGTPTRLHDWALPAGASTRRVQGLGGIPSSGVSAVALNAAAVYPAAAGYLALLPGGASVPGTSHLNYLGTPWEIVSNGGVVKLGPPNGADLGLYSTSGYRAVIDATGYFASPAAGTLKYHPISPCRVTGAGVWLPVNAETPISVRGACGIPYGAQAVAGHFVTVTNGAAGHVVLYPNGISLPNTADVNYPAGSVITGNGRIVALGSGGGDLRAFTTQNATLFLDVTGFFLP